MWDVFLTVFMKFTKISKYNDHISRFKDIDLLLNLGLTLFSPSFPRLPVGLVGLKQ